MKKKTFKKTISPQITTKLTQFNEKNVFFVTKKTKKLLTDVERCKAFSMRTAVQLSSGFKTVSSSANDVFDSRIVVNTQILSNNTDIEPILMQIRFKYKDECMLRVWEMCVYIRAAATQCIVNM